jgi:hypothetical protein
MCQTNDASSAFNIYIYRGGGDSGLVRTLFFFLKKKAMCAGGALHARASLLVWHMPRRPPWRPRSPCLVCDVVLASL